MTLKSLIFSAKLPAKDGQDLAHLCITLCHSVQRGTLLNKLPMFVFDPDTTSHPCLRTAILRRHLDTSNSRQTMRGGQQLMEILPDVFPSAYVPSQKPFSA